MKISELNDEDVLSFLMTSEFQDDYSTVELKYLLVKWRYFFRLSQGRNEQIKIKSEGDIQSLEDEKNILNNTINQLRIRLDDKDILIESLKNRKLTFKERWSGKIILNKEDEDKRL